MRVLVTGSAGLLGSHLVEQLKGSNHEIIGTYYCRKPHLRDKTIDYLQVDLRESEDCRRAVRGSNIVFLCAANTGGITKTQGSSKPVTDTLKINAQLLDLCAEEKVDQVFLISSTTIYPDRNTPFSEDDGFIGEPCAAYFGIGWMHRYLEKLAQYYHQTFGLTVTVIRPTNLYGPYDNFADQGSHVIPSLVRKFLQADQTVQIWGDGSQQRDFIYAGDVATLLVSLIGKAEYTGPFNIGSGQGVSIGQLAKDVAIATGRTDIEIVFDTTKPTGVPIRLVDVSLSKSSLNFTPSHTLIEGLKKTVEWFSQEHN
jgi:GDP-L-fucose synthase